MAVYVLVIFETGKKEMFLHRFETSTCTAKVVNKYIFMRYSDLKQSLPGLFFLFWLDQSVALRSISGTNVRPRAFPLGRMHAARDRE